MTLRVRDSQGALVPVIEGVLRLEEARVYYLESPAEGARPRAWLGERELSWGADRTGAEIEVGHWIGASVLRTVLDDRETTVRVEVGPRSEKLSDATWLAMLGELEAWTAGLSVGLEGGGVGAVGHEGSPAPVAAIALLPLVPALISAVRCVARSPREHATSVRQAVPLRAVRRADRETLHWLGRNPGTARAVDRWRVAETGVLDPYVPQETTRDTVDHPVNRYVAWLIRRVEQRLADLAEALGRHARHPMIQSDTAEWCRARSDATARAAEELALMRKRTLFGRLPPSPPTEAALLAIQDDPTYARVHSLGRPFLSPRFRLLDSQEGGEVPTKPSFELYELWTLLAVQRALSARLQRWTWEWRPGDGPRLFAGIGRGATFTGFRPDGAALRVHYNLTFRGFLNRGDADRYSISRERRPDIVVSFQPPSGEARWMCLDAKYRVRPSALAESFESLHIYRDALRWDALGGACRGGMLLVPATDPACAPWFSVEFLERFGVAAWRFTPGEPIDERWADRVLGILSAIVTR